MGTTSPVRFMAYLFLPETTTIPISPFEPRTTVPPSTPTQLAKVYSMGISVISPTLIGAPALTSLIFNAASPSVSSLANQPATG